MSTQTLSTDKFLEVRIPASRYENPFTNDTVSQSAYEVSLAIGLTDVPDKNYNQMVEMLPQGSRMSALEEIAHLIQREAQLKAEGKNPREALNDPIFDRFIKGNPYRWTHTNVALRAPNGAKSLSKYKENHDGKDYVRADYIRGDKIVAEGVSVPVGYGSKIVSWIPGLWIPATVSDDNVEHTSHWYLDAGKKEVSVVLYGLRYLDEHGRCLYVDAVSGRSSAGSNGAFRVVQGSLNDIPDPVVEQFVKDRESYDKGVAKGRKEARVELVAELQALLERYKQ